MDVITILIQFLVRNCLHSFLDRWVKRVWAHGVTTITGSSISAKPKSLWWKTAVLMCKFFKKNPCMCLHVWTMKPKISFVKWPPKSNQFIHESRLTNEKPEPWRLRPRLLLVQRVFFLFTFINVGAAAPIMLLTLLPWSQRLNTWVYLDSILYTWVYQMDCKRKWTKTL